MHSAAFGFVARTILGPPPMVRRAVVDLGSADLNGSVRQLFTGSRYVGVDLMQAPGVDVVADAATFAPPFVPDTVVCCEVLEHAENAEQIVVNAHRMLAPGGLFIVTCAGQDRRPHSAVDGGDLRPGEFYRNVTVAEMQKWLAPFAEYRIERYPPAENRYQMHKPIEDLWAVAWKGAE